MKQDENFHSMTFDYIPITNVKLNREDENFHNVIFDYISIANVKLNREFIKPWAFTPRYWVKSIMNSHKGEVFDQLAMVVVDEGRQIR